MGWAQAQDQEAEVAFKWAQRKDRILITIDLQVIHIFDKETHMQFSFIPPSFSDLVFVVPEASIIMLELTTGMKSHRHADNECINFRVSLTKYSR